MAIGDPLSSDAVYWLFKIEKNKIHRNLHYSQIVLFCSEIFYLFPSARLVKFASKCYWVDFSEPLSAAHTDKLIRRDRDY